MRSAVTVRVTLASCVSDWTPARSEPYSSSMALLQPATGQLGSVAVGAPLPGEFVLSHAPGESVQRVPIATGCYAFVRADRTVDALEVDAAYPHRILGCFCVGDAVEELFAEGHETPRFGAEFVELADAALYFLFESGMALSIRVEGTDVEDGPYSEEEWRSLLRGRIASAAVSRHGEKLYAY